MKDNNELEAQELEVIELTSLDTEVVNDRLNAMAKFFKDLKQDSDDLRKLVVVLREQLDMPLKIESPEQDELRMALAKASLESFALEKTSSAQGNKKAFCLEDTQKASKEALRNNNVALTFEERKNLEGKHVLITTVTHAISGQWKTLTTEAPPTVNVDRNHAIKGGYTLAMKRMVQQLLNLGDE
jgi:hypothetical protein